MRYETVLRKIRDWTKIHTGPFLNTEPRQWEEGEQRGLIAGRP